MIAIDWKRIVAAGVIAGLLFAVAELGILSAAGFDPNVVVRMTAAIVLGRDVLPPPATLDAGITLVAISFHFGLSILLAYLYARIISPLTEEVLTAVVLGALVGFALYAFNLYVMTLAFPWFMDGRSWESWFAHLLFGTVLALALRPHDRRFAI